MAARKTRGGGPAREETRTRERAYATWEREGRPHGRALDHWLQAEAELTAEKKGRRRADAGRRATPRAGEAAGKARKRGRSKPSPETG